MTTKKDKDLNLVDGLLHDIAENDAKHGKLSANERRDLEEIADVAQQAALRARKALLDQARKERTAAGKPSVPARLLSMTKEAILDRIRELEELFPGKLAVQHRKLDEVSDDDLRSLLADIEAQADDLTGDA